MIHKIELYLNDEWEDVTNYLQSNSVVRQDRCDEAFAVGSFQLRYSRNTNIPPYTPCRLNTNEYWFAKSTCRRYLTKGSYFVHDVELLDLTAILSCFILGSKSFSVTGTHKKDYEKIDIIADLMNQKYGVVFEFLDYSFLTKEQEFEFGPGTTMYDALIEIVRSYEMVKVKVVKYEPLLNRYSIKLNLDNSEFVFQGGTLLDEYYTQDSETYGSILESEMTNVIDRSNSIRVSDLTLRSDEFHMTADNCYLILPTRCEKVIDFGLSSPIANLTCYISLSTAYTTHLKNVGMPIDETTRVVKSWQEWCGIIGKDKTDIVQGVEISYFYTPLDSILEEVVEKCGVKREILEEGLWELAYFKAVVGHGAYYALYPHEVNPDPGTTLANRAFRNLQVEWSLMDKMLSKEEWDLLETYEKPKYVYYESGSNRIDGMNTYYNTDFFHKILGTSLGPFLSYRMSKGDIRMTLEDGDSGEGTKVTGSYFYALGDGKENYASIYYSYWVEYLPIVDPLVTHTKTVVPFNEEKQKALARTYDKTSNYVDFDRMIQSLELTNNMCGMPEGTIEYKPNSNTSIPKAFRRITRGSKTWIISCVTVTSSLKRDIVVLNLVSSYSKIADAIGVKTQYNGTKNPLNNIIDRPVLWQISSDSLVNLPKECWAKLSIDGRHLYKRVVLMEKDLIVYAYIEAIDQYCFDRQALPVDSEFTNNYYCNAVPYCNSHNEAQNIQISLGTMPKLSRLESLAMPLYNGGGFTELIYTDVKRIYKDARERILFCVKIENCKIVE